MPRKPTRVRTQLAALAVGRFFITTATRFIFNFLPIFARGLGVSLGSLQSALSIRSLGVLTVPFLIPLSERFGRKAFLYIGLSIFVTGCLVAYFAHNLWIFVFALLLISLAQAFYDPIMRAHLGDIVPYEQRGKAVALTEFSWAGALLVGAPLAGLAITRYGWQSPFIGLALLGVVGIGILWRLIPETTSSATNRMNIGLIWHGLRSNRSLWGAATYVMLIMFSNILIFSSYAGWMERQFAIDVSGLGMAAMVIGSAELLGEILAGWSSDRFGKRRMVLLSVSISIIFNLLLPFTENSLPLAALGLFCLFITFEMSFICIVPIFTELMPEARSVPLAVLAFVPSSARAIGLLVVGSIAGVGGFKLVGFVAGGMALLAAIVFYLLVEDSAENRSSELDFS